MALALASCTASGLPDSSQTDVLFSEGTVTLTDAAGTEIDLPVEVASTPQAHARGLMDRPVVTRGMLFVFDREEPRFFWMKNTLVPLDIMFFDDAGNFVSSTTMIPCVEDPCLSYPSGGPAMFALEMPAGFVAEQAVGEGWKLQIL